MSAFIVGKEHINAILTAAMAGHDGFRWFYDGKWHGLSLDNADQVGQMLLDENVKSVSHRYPDDEMTELPGKCDAEWIIPFKYQIFQRCPKPIETIKLIQCLDYQSCEHSDWKTSESKAFCNYLTETLICKLPGYDDAAWEWTTPYTDNSNIKSLNIK